MTIRSTIQTLTHNKLCQTYFLHCAAAAAVRFPTQQLKKLIEGRNEAPYHELTVFINLTLTDHSTPTAS